MCTSFSGHHGDFPDSDRDITLGLSQYADDMLPSMMSVDDYCSKSSVNTINPNADRHAPIKLDSS